MTELFLRHIWGGAVMQEMSWKYLKCVDCDCNMALDNVTEYEEFKICPKCGRKELLIKKIRKERTSQ